MIKTILKKSLVLLALAIALTGCTDSISSSGYGRQMSPEEKLAYDNYCIYFSSDSAVTLKTANEDQNWDGTLYYSTDLENWSVWDGTEITSGKDNIIYLRGTKNSVITGINDDSNRFITNSNNAISCYGNIMTLLDYEKVQNNEEPVMGDYCFAYLFMYDNKQLRTAPELPATTLAKGCYEYMFGCTSIIAAPELPATTLVDSCYDSMFYCCTSLTTASELPAEKLVFYCYGAMYYNCSSLIAAPALPAKSLDMFCYFNMFWGCTSLTTIPELPATTLVDSCYMNMFSGCTNIKVYETKTDDKKEYYEWTAPENPDNYEDCYFNMFTQTGGEFTNTPQPGTTYYILRPAAEE